MVTGNNFCIDYCNLSLNFVNYFVICFDNYHFICDNLIYYMNYSLIYCLGNPDFDGLNNFYFYFVNSFYFCCMMSSLLIIGIVSIPWVRLGTGSRNNFCCIGFRS